MGNFVPYDYARTPSQKELCDILYNQNSYLLSAGQISIDRTMTKVPKKIVTDKAFKNAVTAILRVIKLKSTCAINQYEK